MRVLHQTCAGMDVHKKDVKVCLVTSDSQGQRQEDVRSFRTMTRDILAMRAWLQAHGCTLIAMESTGVYVRRITARAISLAERTGSGGNPWVNDSPSGESQRGQQHVVEAERPRSRVWSGSARPVCYGESLVA